MNKKTLIKFILILILIAIASFICAYLLFNKDDSYSNININNKSVLTEDNNIEIVNSYYDYSKFDMSDTFYTYEDDDYTSMIGIDVSEHNETIDFNKVKESGIEFVYIRIGWRGYTEGGLYLDNKYEEYLKGAKEAGLKIGVYFFSQAINKQEAINEAKFVLNTLNSEKLDLPIVYDFENIVGDEARSDGLSKKEITDNALCFFSVLENKYDVMLYGNKYLLDNYYDMDRLKNYKLWFAQYYRTPETSYEFTIWQYSESAIIEGIDKETDLNIMMIKKD